MHDGLIILLYKFRPLQTDIAFHGPDQSINFLEALVLIVVCDLHMVAALFTWPSFAKNRRSTVVTIENTEVCMIKRVWRDSG